MTRTVNRLLAPIARRVRLMARRAVVRLVYDDPKMQELQLSIFSGEVRDKVERFQDYGFTSHPIKGAEAVVLALGGNTDHGAVIRVDDRRYRITGLAEGEVALYDDQGQMVVLKRDKTIHITGTDHLIADIGTDAVVTCPQVTVNASSQVSLNTPTVACSANLIVGGDVAVTGAIAAGGNIGSGAQVSDASGSMASMRVIFNGHDHDYSDGGGTTQDPNQSM